MILFPIALIWLAVALWWIIRNSTNEPDLPDAEPSWRRFVPRVPKRPWSTGSRSRSRTAETASRRRG